MTAETLVWADGRTDWEALQSVPEIWDTVSTATAGAPAIPQSVAGAVQNGSGSSSAPEPALGDAKQAAAMTGQQPGKRRVAVVAKAAEAAPEDSELAAFQAEMSALGAVPVPGAPLACYGYGQSWLDLSRTDFAAARFIQQVVPGVIPIAVERVCPSHIDTEICLQWVLLQRSSRHACRVHHVPT